MKSGHYRGGNVETRFDCRMLWNPATRHPCLTVVTQMRFGSRNHTFFAHLYQREILLSFHDKRAPVWLTRTPYGVRFACRVVCSSSRVLAFAIRPNLPQLLNEPNCSSFECHFFSLSPHMPAYSQKYRKAAPFIAF